MNYFENPVFIVGYPKSGTSLLHGLLDSNEQVLTFPEETQFFSRVFGEIEFSEKNDDLKVDQLLATMKTKSGLRYLNMGQADDSIRGNYDYSNFDYQLFESVFVEYLKSNGVSTKNCFLAVAEGFYKVYNRSESDLKCWIEKTPRHFAYLDEILNDFPKSKFIHVIRDPRDNWVSYKKKKESLSLERYCYTWKNSVKVAHKASKLISDQHLILKYEDLVLESEKMMRKVAEFIDIEYSENLLIPTKNGVPWDGNSMWGERSKKISTSPIGRYKEHGNPHEVALIESVLKNDLEYFNYEFSDLKKVKKPVSYSLVSFKRDLMRKYKYKSKTFK